MSDWLVFYNTELAHLSTKPNLKKTTSLSNLPVPPIEFLLRSHPQSRMYWTNTLKILNHWHKFGLASAVHAFSVSKSTLYAWRKLLAQAGGNTAALKPASKRPKRVRAAVWCPQVMAELKRLRQSIPNLGKEKVFAKLVPFCQQHGLALPSVSTIGRMIASAPDKLRTSA